MDLTLKTPPSATSIDVALVKLGKRISHNSEDALILGWIKAADLYLEKRMNRAMMAQTYVLRLRRVLRTVYLPRPPLASISHVKYTPEGGSEVTVAEADYRQSTDRMVARLDIFEIPMLGRAGTMEIEYIAGYEKSEDVPADLRQAACLLAAAWVSSREATYQEPRIMQVEKKISFGVDQLVKEYRVPNGTDLNGGW